MLSMPTALKEHTDRMPTFAGRSDALIQTSLLYGGDARSFYLQDPERQPPPVISRSAFVPDSMVEHLMRNKKNSALGVKYIPGCVPPDQITDMEGALHTYVNPLVHTYLHGDYAYRGFHGVQTFASKGGRDQARNVVISALIQPDFENKNVMLKLASLTRDFCVGEALPKDFVIDAEVKQDAQSRASYDDQLRRHMIANLVADGRLPARKDVEGAVPSLDETLPFLEAQICSPEPIAPVFQSKYVLLRNGHIISLELLFNSAVEQIRNELSALETVCPQGYVYTFDPPSIFAREIDVLLLNRLQFAALKHLSGGSHFSRMRAFGFNNYADPDAVQLLKQALAAQTHVQVVAKETIFPKPKCFYKALPRTKGAMLVLHNNSDGFGQNIETESDGGSMDGALGANSSAAASLHRQRPDLVKFIM